MQFHEKLQITPQLYRCTVCLYYTFLFSRHVESRQALFFSVPVALQSSSDPRLHNGIHPLLMPASVSHPAPSTFFLFCWGKLFSTPPKPPLSSLAACIDAQQTMFAGHFQSHGYSTRQGSTLAGTHVSVWKMEGKVKIYPSFFELERTTL